MFYFLIILAAGVAWGYISSSLKLQMAQLDTVDAIRKSVQEANKKASTPPPIPKPTKSWGTKL